MRGCKGEEGEEEDQTCQGEVRRVRAWCVGRQVVKKVGRWAGTGSSLGPPFPVFFVFLKMGKKKSLLSVFPSRDQVWEELRQHELWYVPKYNTGGKYF